MGQKLDLNKLRDIVHDNERRGDELPAAKAKKVFVDREGDVKLGDTVSDREARVLSEVPQSTFAHRLAAEGEVVRAKMPANTKAVTTREGVKGWQYSIRSQLGDRFTFFAYDDGSNYQVLVLAPVLEAKWKSAHTGHLYSDGRICMGTG